MIKQKGVTYTVRAVKKRGKKDGSDKYWDFTSWPFRKTKQTDPPLDQAEPTEYEEKLLQFSRENLKRLTQRWSSLDERMYKSCLDTEDQYHAAKAAIERESAEHREAIGKYEAAKARFFSFPVPHIPPTVYWFLFAVVTVGEVLFNTTVFSVLGQDTLETYLMVISLMVMIPFLSDFIGKKLRAERKSSTTVMLMSGAAAVVFAVLSALALAREKFFEASKVVEMLDIQWSSTSLMLTFFIVNVVLFVGMIVLAYEAAHKDPSAYKQARNEYEDAEKKLRKEAGDSEQAAQALAAARIAYNKAHTERKKQFEQHRYRAEEERDIWIGMVQTYRSSNMAARQEKAKPASFNVELAHLIEIPQPLTALECKKCRFEEVR